MLAHEKHQTRAFPTTATTRKHVESKNLWWDTKTLLVGKFGNKVQSRKVIHRIISLDDVKFVKNTMNVKVNDVFLGMTQAGLSKYLSKKYGKFIFHKYTFTLSISSFHAENYNIIGI
ncbi:unnamed protein product [Brassica napus]|uniref:(rape) hypothetical protein n=1 Tax=Brassica napus TaxID=3708 RepID=A0A816TRJ5_BRANA|nr:unnamed protein product [Brassica napus]